MSIPLPLFHRLAGQTVIVAGDGEVAEARCRLVERAGGIVSKSIADGLARGARLAFLAPAPGIGVDGDVARLRAAGVLVNVADQPALCDFIVPAVVERAPVMVAVGTGGASAGLAKALRLRLEELLPPALGTLATALGAARGALRARFADVGERRRALDHALAAGGPLDPLRAGSEGQVEAWLASPGEGQPGEVVEIRPRSNDPDDLTLREARWLGSADILAHEADAPEAILSRARADAIRLVLAPGERPEAAGQLVVVVRRPG